ncbi:hypothetical protein ACQEU3_44515 [Spirillospora sp. CA-253888]
MLSLSVAFAEFDAVRRLPPLNALVRPRSTGAYAAGVSEKIPDELIDLVKLKARFLWAERQYA